jgi:hypothetical protein
MEKEYILYVETHPSLELVVNKTLWLILAISNILLVISKLTRAVDPYPVNDLYLFSRRRNHQRKNVVSYVPQDLHILEFSGGNTFSTL